MSEIEFSEEEKRVIVEKLQSYFYKEMGQELGQFEGEFLLDFISSEIGAYYYNRGLSDAQVVLAGRIDDLTEAFYEIEKPVNFQNK